MATPVLDRKVHLSDVEDVLLIELIEGRRRHGPVRMVSVITMAITALALHHAGLVPATWGALLLYGLPCTTLLLGDIFLVRRWRRQALALGVSDEALDALRAHLRAMPPGHGQATAAQLARFVRRREREMLALASSTTGDQSSAS
jgi:hypothetical protein